MFLTMRPKTGRIRNPETGAIDTLSALDVVIKPIDIPQMRRGITLPRRPSRRPGRNLRRLKKRNVSPGSTMTRFFWGNLTSSSFQRERRSATGP